MKGKSMKIKLGQPRLALIWFIPAESIFADLEAQIKAVPSAPPDEPSDEEAAEAIREATGFDINNIVSLLKGAAEQYERDPKSIEDAIRAIVGDNEIAAKWLLDLILDMRPENDNGHEEEEPTEEGGQILDFERPDESGNDDDGGDEP